MPEEELMPQITFTAYLTPQPQGSSRGFNRGGKIVITSANKNLKPYRHHLTQIAMEERNKQNFEMIGKHVPVGAVFTFYFERPASCPKKRKHMVVKPDLSKVLRSTEDSLTGVIYADDAQIVEENIRKEYGSPERVEISIYTL